MLKLAVIGDPIEHSLSPKIHSTVFSYLGLACEYTAHQVKKGELYEWIKYAKHEGITGFNITMPHKLDIIEYLDELDDMQYGAVNTVKITDGRLTGYNTDGRGFCMSLEERGIRIYGKNVLITGAGGAAKVLSTVAKKECAESVTTLGRKELGDIGARADFTDIFINATPLGMHATGTDWERLDFVGMFPPHCTIVDLIYNPLQTTLLKKAEERGLLTVNGLGMLIYQAIYADEIYLDKELDVKKIRDAIGNPMF